MPRNDTYKGGFNSDDDDNFCLVSPRSEEQATACLKAQGRDTNGPPSRRLKPTKELSQKISNEEMELSQQASNEQMELSQPTSNEQMEVLELSLQTASLNLYHFKNPTL